MCADLEAAATRFALVGGLAVSARAEPRLTRDVDVAVAVANDAEAESVIHRLLSSGYVLVSLVEQTRRGRLATARLTPPASALLAIATGPERRRVARAIGLIQAKGFARGRDLAASWRRLRS